MKKAKKILSLVLAVLMLYSGMSVGMTAFATSVKIDGAVDKTYTSTDDVVISVPETIYMTPSTGASTTAQYYVNNIIDVNGQVKLEQDNDNTAGYVAIYAPGMTDFKYTTAILDQGDDSVAFGYEGGFITTQAMVDQGMGDTKGYIYFSGVNLTALKSGISAGNTAVVEWTFTLKINGVEKIYYAYSTLYSPVYRAIGGTAEGSAKAMSRKAQNVGISGWITGIHSVDTSVANKFGGDSGADASGYFKNEPLLKLNTVYGGSMKTTDDLVTTSSDISYVRAYYVSPYSSTASNVTNGEKQTQINSYLGLLTVDKSRYSNLKYIPNLYVGAELNNTDNNYEWDDEFFRSWYSLSDGNSFQNKGATESPSGWTNWVNFYPNEFNKSATATYVLSNNGAAYSKSYSSYNDFCNDMNSGKAARLYDSVDLDISSVNTSSTYYIYSMVQSMIKSRYSSSNYKRAFANVYSSVKLTFVDKSALRQLVLQGTSLNQNNYTEASWSAYKTALRDAAKALGNPTNSTVDTSTLTSKMNALQTKVKLNANGGSINGASESTVGITVGAASSATYNLSSYVPTRDGYTFKGWATSRTATSGSTSVSAGLTPTFYAIWESTVYTIVFDTLIDFTKWNTTSASNATISNVTANGFTLTSNEGVGEGTSASPYFPVTPGKQYKIDIDFEGDAWDVYIFFCDANGSWVDFSDGPSNRYSSNGSTGISADNAVFTAPNKSEVVKAQIRLDANGSSNSVRFSNIRVYEVGVGADNVTYHAPVKVTAGGTYGDLPDPTRPGYTFAGWYDANGNGYGDNGNVAISADTVVYSTWNANSYKVTFEKNIGDGTSVQESYKPDENVTVPTITRNGYVLKGWKVKTADGNWSGTYNAGDVLSGMYGSPILEAQWEKVSYTITYDTNGGNAIDPVSYNIESTVTLPLPTRTGYTFAGWNVEKTTGNWSGTNLSGNVSAKYGNVTLKAQWTAIPYAIVFYNWDGSVLKQADVDFDSMPVPPADPTKPADNGYTYNFSGWDPTVSVVTGAANYTAQFTPELIPYTITLDAGEGSVSTTTINYNYESTSVTLPDATKTGYTFNGWKIKESVGSWTQGATVNGTLDKAWGNVTLVADYTANNYVLDFDLNDSDRIGDATRSDSDSTFSFAYNGKITALPTATLVGYTFDGWYVGDTKLNVGDTWTYAENVTAKAQWTPNTYTLTFVTYDLVNKKANFIDAPANLEYTIETDLSQALVVPEAEGYTFGYWESMTTNGNWNLMETFGTDTEPVPTTGKYGNAQIYMYYNLNQYDIVFKNEDGSVLQSGKVYHGKTPSYTGAEPTKAPTDVNSFDFAGWTPEIAVATGNATYTATYTSKPREYTVTFLDADGSVISEQKLNYGATVNVPADPTKEQDAQYTYTFTYWKDAQGNKVDTIPTVSADVTYTADYTATLRTYTITWIVDGVTTTTTVAYGSDPVYNNGVDPTKEKTDEFTYTFEGWSPALASVTGEATYEAQFSSTTNEYTVTFVNYDGTELDKQVLKYGETPVYAGVTPEKPADKQYTYTFSGWDPEINSVTGDVTYTAVYSETVNQYTITFKDEGGNVLQSGDWDYGATPVYSGETPAKAATVQYTYEFDGWTPELKEVDGDAEYTVKFKAITNKYTVTFTNEDGTVLQSTDVEYGTTPAYTGETPEKEGNVQYSYTFAGWTPEISEVTGAVTYKATYTQTTNKYLVEFVDDNGTVLKSEEVEYGTVPTAPANPTKAADKQYTYTFNGWDNTIVAVNGAAKYTATYTSTVNQYKVTFVNWDDTVLSTQTLDYGEMPTAPADPTRPATDAFTYVFDTWSPAITTVEGEVTYKAIYVKTQRTYLITFVDYDGTEITSGPVAYGETPVKPADPSREATAQYTYTFAGWTPEVATVTGAETYTATYDAAVNQYTVTFYNEDGSAVLDTQTLDYGTALEYKGELPTKAPIDGVEYAFSGWGTAANATDVIALPAVTADVAYYAVFIATNIKLDVSWYLEDGTLADTEKVEYGTIASTLTFPENQTREDTAQYDYEFIGWNVVENSETALDLTTYKITAATTFYPAFSKTVKEYKITFYDEDGVTVLESKDVPYGTVPTAATPTKAADAQYTYTFAGWTPEVVAVTEDASYKATYSEALNYYTITFVDDDGTTVLKTESVGYGFMPTAPANPTKTATAQYTYTFKAWDKEIVKVTEAATYKATYDAAVNNYLVTFVNYDGTELQSGELAYGETPVYSGATPVKEGNAQYSYTFAGWSPEISTVTGKATYTATFTESVNEYTIKFVNEDGTVLQSSEVAYGDTPVYGGATPEKAATAQYTYTFAAWDKEVVSVTGEATYTATYSSTVNKYTIKFVNEDGTVLQSTEVEYGQTPAYTGATPEKAADAQYTYTFKSWDKEIVSVTEAATYTATYYNTVNKYLIRFVNEDGTVLQESEVEYGQTPVYTGATPTKAATAQYTYTFDKWSPAVVSVTGTATYTATYSSTVNKYTITFVDEDGTTVLYSEDVEYGQTPVYGGETPTKAATAQFTYTFDTWDKAIVSVTGEATYTATYSFVVNKYTVKFLNADGSVLQSGEWEYGYTPVYSGETPVKASTASTDFTFKGWDKNIVSVTEDATYTATYTETTRKYTITWVVNGEETKVDVEYGTTPVFDGTPVKESTAEFEYEFKGWTPEVVDVVGEATYTAEFTAKTRTYKVTWITGSGEFTGVWEYGTTPDPVVDNVNTSKPDTAEAVYTFTRWDKEISVVTGNVTYTAEYDEDVKSYKVTYMIGDEIVEEVMIKFGSSFNHPAIPEKTGHSAYWNCTFVTMPARDITIKAVFEAKKYTVTWVADGITVAVDEVVFGTEIPVQVVPDMAGNTGVWEEIPETMPAENIVISAIYIPNVYVVTWNFAYTAGTDIATFGVDYSVTFKAAYLPLFVRVTVDGVLVSDDMYSYDYVTGEFFLVGTAITGAVSITEKAAEGYQNVVVAVSNAVLSNNSSVVEQGHSYHTQIIPAEGYLLPETVAVFIDGVELYYGYTYDANTGRLTVNAEMMVGELTISVDCPVDPDYEPADGDACGCSCHGNSFVRFFFKIITMLRKLFGMKQYQYCDCGVAHW